LLKRLDGLFLPKTSELDNPFYLVEVQFQPDAGLYYRIFAELFIFLRQYQPSHPWQIVVIYPNRRIEREQTLHFGNLLALNQVRRIYLDELGEAAEGSLGVEVVKLVIEPEETAGQLARQLIEKARQQLTDEAIQRNLINLIETIIVYKLPQKSRKEIAAMLNLSDLKQTRVYQEILEEFKLETIPRMLKFGFSEDAIAQVLDLPLEVVQQTAQSQGIQPMSSDERNVAAFIELLTNRRTLFTPEELTELDQLIATLPDDIEQLSEAITAWCKQDERAEILKIWRQIRETFPISIGEKAPGSKEGKVKPPNHELNKQAILNAIQQSSDSKDSQSSNSGSIPM
jgi:predicted transposase/invertase (TIGR01784 family)